MRNNFNNVIDFEIIFVYNIKFFDVVNIVICEIIVVDITNKINNITNNITNKTNKIFNTIVINFFICFVRICLCNLILFKNLTKQRLYKKKCFFCYAIFFDLLLFKLFLNNLII